MSERTRRRRRRRALLVGGGAVVLVAAVVLAIGFAAQSAPVEVTATPTPTVTPTPVETATPTAAPVETATPEPTPTATPTPVADIDSASSLEVVVNKKRPLAGAADYVPVDLVGVAGGEELRAEAAGALATMFAAAADAGHGLIAQSGYRGYSVQNRVYNNWVAELGQTGADLTSARPGFSEHQTGLAMDILDDVSGCGLNDRCLGDAPSGQWLAAESWRYGFVLRYPDGQTAITGYEYEPWHFRYIGVAAATRYHDSGAATLEAFYGLPPAETY